MRFLLPTSMVVLEAGEQLDQLVALGLSQRREQAILDGGHELVQATQVLTPRPGDGDDITATVDPALAALRG
jgi:hypothetical protein